LNTVLWFAICCIFIEKNPAGFSHYARHVIVSNFFFIEFIFHETRDFSQLFWLFIYLFIYLFLMEQCAHTPCTHLARDGDRNWEPHSTLETKGHGANWPKRRWYLFICLFNNLMFIYYSLTDDVVTNSRVMATGICRFFFNYFNYLFVCLIIWCLRRMGVIWYLGFCIYKLLKKTTNAR